MTTQIDALTAELTNKGFKVSAWKGQRIYFNGLGRDIKAYINFDEPLADAEACDGEMKLYAGCGLKVWSDCDQSRQWLINRAKQVKHGLIKRLVEANVAPGPVCDRWEDVCL